MYNETPNKNDFLSKEQQGFKYSVQKKREVPRSTGSKEQKKGRGKNSAPAWQLERAHGQTITKRPIYGRFGVQTTWTELRRYIFIPCTEMLRGTLSPFPVLLTRLFFSEGKYLYLSNRPHSATCLHVMAFYVVPSHVRDIKDMAQVRMPFRSWIFWHWELPRIRVSIQTYPNHLLVPMSHVFPRFWFLGRVIRGLWMKVVTSNASDMNLRVKLQIVYV